MRRLLPVIVTLISLFAGPLVMTGPALAQTTDGQSSGQPIPRMASIKSTEANVRRGPGVDYRIQWVYRQIDMPVQVIGEFEKWRKIRDWEGDEGWVHFALLSPRRTIIVTAPETTLRRLAADESPATARLAQGMVARIELCEPDWCLVTVQGYDGWLKRSDVWGVETGEEVR